MIWTDQQIIILTAEWLRGVTAAEIAAMLGDGVTPSAVRGKRLHLNLPPRTGEVQREAEKQNGRKSRTAKPPAPADEPDAEKLAPLPGSTPRPWLTRDFGECAFPVEGESFNTRSCCLPVAPRRAYCPGHVRIMRGG